MWSLSSKKGKKKLQLNTGNFVYTKSMPQKQAPLSSQGLPTRAGYAFSQCVNSFCFSLTQQDPITIQGSYLQWVLCSFETDHCCDPDRSSMVTQLDLGITTPSYLAASAGHRRDKCLITKEKVINFHCSNLQSRHNAQILHILHSQYSEHYLD